MSTARAIALLQEAIAVLSGQVNAPATQAGVDAAAAQYLRDNADVAKHIYFSKHPLEHYQVHGQAEGRKWPTSAMREPEPVTHPAWHDPESEPEAPQPTVKEASPELRNFRHLRETLGDDAAYDYLIKHVAGGGNLVRDRFADRQESARIVNRYAVGAARGRVEGDEYVYGPAFTEGKRVKLPG